MGWRVRQAGVDDWWQVSELHCRSFYPAAGCLLGVLLRFDRVESLQVEVLSPVPALASPPLNPPYQLSHQLSAGHRKFSQGCHLVIILAITRLVALGLSSQCPCSIMFQYLSGINRSSPQLRSRLHPKLEPAYFVCVGRNSHWRFSAEIETQEGSACVF